MSYWNELVGFLYGQGFWYATSKNHLKGLSNDDLYKTIADNTFPIIWHIGHITHREKYHFDVIIKGNKHNPIPKEFEMFGTDWIPASKINTGAVKSEVVISWADMVRKESFEFMRNLSEDDFKKPIFNPLEGHTIGHWIFITACHTSLHIGKIQTIRDILLKQKENPC